MKLLLDQNISFRVKRSIQHKFEGTLHLRDLGHQNFTGKQIWDFAKQNQFSIVTFDAGFFNFQIFTDIHLK